MRQCQARLSLFLQVPKVLPAPKELRALLVLKACKGLGIFRVSKASKGLRAFRVSKAPKGLRVSTGLLAVLPEEQVPQLSIVVPLKRVLSSASLVK